MGGRILSALTLAALASIGLSLGLAVAATAQETTVGPNDTVTLHVLDWDPVEGAVTDWTALSGEFRVQADGMLDLPFIAPVRAVGRTTAEIADEVATALGERFALSQPPDTTILVNGRQPVIVSGLVRNPGEVDYTPGMTVRHAVALAGGPEQTLRRGTEAFRAMIDTQGTLRLLALERMRLRITLARLQAERAGADEVAMPPSLSGPMAERLLAEETEVMDRRRARLASEREALGDQITLLENEIASLEQRLSGFERQRALSQEALDNVTSLAGDGLVVSNRIIDSERALLLIENQLLDTTTAILRARLNAAATQRELEDIEFRLESDLVEQMISLEAQLADTEQRIETSARLIDIDEIRVAELLDAGPETPRMGDATYRIYRLDGSEIAARPDTRLQPGDLVEMTVTPPAGPPRQLTTN